MLKKYARPADIPGEIKSTDTSLMQARAAGTD
jgi:hypothetical protein